MKNTKSNTETPKAMNIQIPEQLHAEILEICDNVGSRIKKLTTKVLRKFVKDFKKDPSVYIKMLGDKDLI